jgi:hypothetical protein
MVHSSWKRIQYQRITADGNMGTVRIQHCVAVGPNCLEKSALIKLLGLCRVTYSEQSNKMHQKTQLSSIENFFLSEVFREEIQLVKFPSL